MPSRKSTVAAQLGRALGWPALSQECVPIFRRKAETAAEIGARTPLPEGAITPEWFDADRCRNCGEVRETPHCGQCGQKAASRFLWRDIGKEGWERLRWFELRLPRTLTRLVTGPGTVAREYVLGRRTAYSHPLTLLVALVAVLVLMLAANRYFGIHAFGQDAQVDRMAERVMAFANWSFSLGIVAIFLGSIIVFRRRCGYNFIEHAVLAIYCQCIILAVIILNLLPTLIWRSPDFILLHKAASQYYVFAIKLAIVAVAYRQFFLLDLRKDWLKLLLACAVFVGVNWLLLRLYALAILKLVI